MKANALLSILLLLVVGLAGCTDGDDSDGDGLPNDLEERGRLTFVYYMTEVVELQIDSDPTKMDTDGDGLDDYVEMFGRSIAGLLALDPRNPDTDGDGLSDCQEWPVQTDGKCPLLGGQFVEYDYFAYQTDPSRADGDLKGPSRYNLYRINGGEGYRDATENGELLPSYSAVKGDGISDYDEIFGYDVVLHDGTMVRGVVTDPNAVDSDGDGLEDGEESLLFGTNPLVDDSDGDGCIDGRDPVPYSAETYGVDFGRFHYGGSSGSPSSISLVTVLQLADALVFTPTEGTYDVAKGDTLDIGGMSFDDLAPASCTLANPNIPWLEVQVLTHHRTDDSGNSHQDAFFTGGLSAIDTWSESIPADNDSPSVLWNIQHDVYRWTRPEDPLTWSMETDDEWFVGGPEGFIRLMGPEGWVEFSITVDGL